MASLLQLSDAGHRIQESECDLTRGTLLCYNVSHLPSLQGVRELHIGHSIVSRSILIGMRDAVRRNETLIRDGPMSTPPVDHAGVPYRIAVLVHLTDGQGRRLLPQRTASPIRMHSPIGGENLKSKTENRHTRAVREVHEETGIVLQENEVHLLGMVSERAYE